MSTWVEPSRITVVPTGVYLQQYRPEASPLAADPLVVFVGAMDAGDGSLAAEVAGSPASVELDGRFQTEPANRRTTAFFRCVLSGAEFARATRQHNLRVLKFALSAA